MSGIHLMLLGGSSRATTGPSIANLVYAPYSNNIDTVVETSRKSFSATYGTDSSFLLESNNTLIRPYSRLGGTIIRFNSVGSVAATTLNSSRALPSFSNYEALWTTQSPDPQYQFVSYYNSTAGKTYIGRVALTGTNTSSGELWTGTETPADIAVPTSQYAFVLRTNGQIQRRTMGTAWGLNFISTQTWNSPYTTLTRRISFSPTGDKLYVAMDDIVYEHVMGVPYDLTTISGSALRSATVAGSSFQLQGGHYGLSNSGNFAFYQYILGSKQVSGITYPGGSAPSFNDAGYVAPNGTDVFLMYRSTVSGGVVTQFVQKITLGSSYNPSTITVSQQAPVSTGSAQVTGVFFKSDGTKAFFLRQSDVLAFNLSTAWDLSTMTSDTSYAFTLTFLPQGIWFSTDGTKFFVSDATFDAVFQYDLSVAWDISTAVQGSQIFFSGVTTLVGGLSFNSSGSVMYLCTGEGRKVLQFDLTVPWNIATAVFVRSREMGMVGVITDQLSINSSQNKALVISRSSLGFPILSAFDI